MPALRFEYPEQVHFICQRCALCCGDTKTRTRRILLLQNEVKRISEKTSMKLNDFVIRLKDSGPFDYIMRKKKGKCIFLKDKLCSIYEVRPIICRFYPFKLENLGGKKYRFSYTDECPSIGKGPLLKRTFYEALFKKFLILISNEHAN